MSDSLTVNPVPYIGIYDLQCDLDYAGSSLPAILSDLYSRYGFRISTEPYMSDIHFILEGDPDDVDSFVFELCIQHHVHLNLVYKANVRSVGLSGEDDNVNTVLSILKHKFAISNIERNEKIRIDLQGSQMSYGEIIHQLAKKTGLGISYDNSYLKLLRNNRQVLAYSKIEPFHIYLSKETTTGRLIIDLLHSPYSLVDRVDEVELRDVVWHANDRAMAVSGRNTIAEQSVRPDGRIEWVSDDPVDWAERFAVRGVIHGRLLHREYQADNLQIGTTIQAHDLTISVHKTSVGFDEPVFGIHWIPDEVEGDWICVRVETKGALNEEEKQFIRNAEEKQLKGEKIPEEIMQRYESFAVDKMSLLRVVSIGKPAKKSQDDDFGWFVKPSAVTAIENLRLLKYQGIHSKTFRHSVDSIEVYFDSIQDGEVVFPIGIHIREYKPSKVEFVIENKVNKENETKPETFSSEPKD